MNKTIISLISSVMMAGGVIAFAKDIRENVFLYGKGKLLWSEETQQADGVSVDKNAGKLSVCDKEGKVLYTAYIQDVDSITFSYSAPVADLLDIRFNADGTASDVSEMHNIVESHSGNVTTIYEPSLGGYLARFNNIWSGSQGVAGYYKVNYENNDKFKNALADGHTLEAIVSGNWEGDLSSAENNKEVKFLSSHEAGGTGLMLANSGHNQELSYLVNVTENGASNWRWGNSGIVPQKGKYYHIIGVWDKENNKGYTYVNGKLAKEFSTAGEYRHATAGNRWFGIGCDAGPTPQLAWRGDILRARVYDKPLTAEEISALWEEAEHIIKNITPPMVSDVKYYSGLSLKEGSSITIEASGFSTGDVIELAPVSDLTLTIPMVTEISDNKAVSVLPSGIRSGNYRIILTRGNMKQDLGQIKINIVDKVPAGAEVVAHRGFWKTAGSAQNSRTGLKKAQELGAYAVETDIWLTTDGVLMINHDASYNGVTIKNSTSEVCKNLTLSNGEKMPTLQDLLSILKKSDTPTKLFIEIKEHGSEELDRKAASAAVKLVKDNNIENKVEYISFSQIACEQVISDAPDAFVAYIKGGIAPSVLKAKGYTGINYHIAEFRNHPEWVEEAKNNGMSVTAWTLNSSAEIIEMMNLGVDIVTTDTPVDAIAIKEIYDLNSK